jgi:hypothetical protein
MSADSAFVKIVIPSEVVDRILLVSDQLAGLVKDLESILSDLSTDSPVLNTYKSLSVNFGIALTHVNKTLDGKSIDLEAYSEIVSKTNQLRALILMNKIRRYENESYNNDSSNSSTMRIDEGVVCDNTEHQDRTSNGDLSEGESGSSDEIHAPAFPLFNGTSHPSSALRKRVQVVTPTATHHEMLDLTDDDNVLVTTYTKLGVRNVIIIDDDDEDNEDTEAISKFVLPIEQGSTSSRIRAARMSLVSAQRRRSARLGYTTPSSSDI